jgi:phosphate transport system permease protein
MLQAARRVRRSFVLEDRLFRAIALASALVVLGLLAGMLVVLFLDAWPALRTFGPMFFATSEWDVVNDKFPGWPPSPELCSPR